MHNDLAMYQAVTEARRLYGEGLPLQAAAAEAAEKYGLHALDVGEAAAKAISECRKVRERNERRRSAEHAEQPEGAA